jgi:hypothetical protein
VLDGEQLTSADLRVAVHVMLAATEYRQAAHRFKERIDRLPDLDRGITMLRDVATDHRPQLGGR